MTLLRSDRGTNFVGAKNELAAALEEMNRPKTKSELAKQSTDFMDFVFNTPHASHMGGVWECMI